MALGRPKKHAKDEPCRMTSMYANRRPGEDTGFPSPARVATVRRFFGAASELNQQDRYDAYLDKQRAQVIELYKEGVPIQQIALKALIAPVYIKHYIAAYEEENA